MSRVAGDLLIYLVCRRRVQIALHWWLNGPGLTFGALDSLCRATWSLHLRIAIHLCRDSRMIQGDAVQLSSLTPGNVYGLGLVARAWRENNLQLVALAYSAGKR